MDKSFFKLVDVSDVDVGGDIMPASGAGAGTALAAVDNAYVMEAAIERFGEWTYRLADLRKMYKVLWYEQPYEVASEIIRRSGQSDVNWADASKRVDAYDQSPSLAYKDLHRVDVPLTQDDNVNLQRGRVLDAGIFGRIYESLDKFMTKAFRRQLDYSQLSEDLLEQEGRVQAPAIAGEVVYSWIKMKH